MRSRSLCVLAFVLLSLGVAEGCVGDDPVGSSSPPPPSGLDGSVPGDSGGPGPGPGTNDSGTPQGDAGVDSGPPACTKIQVTTIAGGAATGNANGAGSVATFSAPEGITVNSTNGDLYVADTGNALIRKVLSDGTTSTFSSAVNNGGSIEPWYAPIRIVYTFSLVGVDSTHDGVFNVGAGAPATRAFSLGSIRSYASQPTTFQQFVVGTNRVAKWTNSGNEATRFSGADFTGGFVDGAGDAARYAELTDLAFDTDADLYVTDRGNHRLRKVTATEGPNYGFVATVAGSATAGHVDGKGGAAQFEGPNALVIDRTTHLIYVADGPTIRVVTPAGDVTTLVGSNAAFADGDGCSAKFVNIKGITKFANELYVVDVNRVRKVVMN